MSSPHLNRVYKVFLLDDSTPVRIQVDFADKHWKNLNRDEYQRLIKSLKSMGEDIRDGYVDKDKYTRIGANEK